MTAASVPRSIRVEASMLRGMTRDAAVYTLTRPLALVAFIAIGAAIVINATLLSLLIAADPERAAQLAFTLLLLAALMTGSIAFTRFSIRRSLVATMPEGSVVGAAVGDKTLRVESAQGLSNIPYETFRSMRVDRDAVLLRLRESSSVTVLPRPLFSDEDIVRLRSAIG